MLRRFSLLASLLLITACSNQAPLSAVQPTAVRLLQSHANARTTQGALSLLEEIAHAQAHQYPQIEAAFQLEIAKSTRPSLKLILAEAAKVMAEHPLPGAEAVAHPVARLVRLAMWRYNILVSDHLIPRIMELFGLANAEPTQQAAKVQVFEKRIQNTPKMDVKTLLQSFHEGHYADIIPPDSALNAQLQKILETRLAARV